MVKMKNPKRSVPMLNLSFSNAHLSAQKKKFYAQNGGKIHIRTVQPGAFGKLGSLKELGGGRLIIAETALRLIASKPNMPVQDLSLIIERDLSGHKITHSPLVKSVPFKPVTFSAVYRVIQLLEKKGLIKKII